MGSGSGSGSGSGVGLGLGLGSNPNPNPDPKQEVVSAALGTPYARATWGVSVASIAAAYREQVLLDYGCFTDYVRSNFSIGPSNYIEKDPDEDEDDEVEFD